MALAPTIQKVLAAFNAQTGALLGFTTSGEAPYQSVMGSASIVTNYPGIRTSLHSQVLQLFASGLSTPGDGGGGMFVFNPSDTTTGALGVGSIAGSVLNISSVGPGAGTFAVGQTISRGDTGAPVATITSLGTGTGGVGTYNLSASASIPGPLIFTGDNNATILVATDGGRWYLIQSAALVAPVVINATTGASTVKIFGPPSTDIQGWHALDLQASLVSGQSLGLRVRGGTTNLDHSFVAQNAAGTVSIFEVFGDNSWGFFTGPFLPALTGTPAGNVTVGSLSVSVPSSGIALTVNGGAANAYALQVNANATAGQSLGLKIQAGTNASDFPFAVANQAGTVTQFLLGGDTSFGFFRSFANPSLSGNAQGAISIAAPAAGIGLSVTGVANAFAQLIKGASTSGQSLGLQIQSGTTAADYALNILNQANTIAFFSIFGDSSWAFERAALTPTLQANASGAVTINPPSAGVALTVDGLSNAFAQVITAGATIGQSLGLQVIAGTTAADYCVNFLNHANTIAFFSIFGDGSWAFQKASLTPTLQANAAGAVTCNFGFGVNGGSTVQPTGYGTPTGGSHQASFAAGSITLANLAAAVAQLIVDLKSNGYVGA